MLKASQSAQIDSNGNYLDHELLSLTRRCGCLAHEVLSLAREVLSLAHMRVSLLKCSVWGTCVLFGS